MTDQPARGLEVEHENLRLQERRGDPLSFAGNFAFEQRGEDAHGAEQAGGKIGHRNAGAHRPLARQAGDRHHPAHALRDLVEARPVAIGPVLAETGNAAENNALIDLLQALVIDAETVLYVGTEILHHDVGFLDHAQEDGAAFRRFEVESHAALVAVQILEIRPLARTARPFALFQARRRLDLDDIGAPIGELTHAGRPRAYARQIEHGEARKGLGCPGKRHFNSSGWLIAAQNCNLRPDIPRSKPACPSGTQWLFGHFIHHSAQ